MARVERGGLPGVASAAEQVLGAASDGSEAEADSGGSWLQTTRVEFLVSHADLLTLGPLAPR